MAGAVKLSVKELDLKETLQLLAERHGLPGPPADLQFPPWVPHDHPFAEVGSAAADSGYLIPLRCLTPVTSSIRKRCWQVARGKAS